MTVKVTLLGTGGPKPDPDRQGPAVLLKTENKNFLIDAGRGVTTRLVQTGVKPEDLDAIFITHHHFDHIGNLGDLILSIWNNGREVALPIYGPNGTAKIVDALLTSVYSADIAFRVREAELTGDTLVDLTGMVDVIEIDEGVALQTEDFQITSERVCHGHGLGMSHEEWPCLGYRFETEGRIVAISGDTVGCEGLDKLAKNADLLVLCCYLASLEQNEFEREVVSKHILVSSDQAGKIARSARVKTLAVTHIREKSAEALLGMEADIRKDFSGKIVIGTDLCELTV